LYRTHLIRLGAREQRVGCDARDDALLCESRGHGGEVPLLADGPDPAVDEQRDGERARVAVAAAAAAAAASSSDRVRDRARAVRERRTVGEVDVHDRARRARIADVADDAHAARVARSRDRVRERAMEAQRADAVRDRAHDAEGFVDEDLADLRRAFELPSARRDRAYVLERGGTTTTTTTRRRGGEGRDG